MSFVDVKDEVKEWLEGYPEPFQFLVREIYGFIWTFLGIFRTHFNPTERLYWLYLVSFILMAGFSYFYYVKKSKAFCPKEFLRFCFPRKLYLHPSAIVDYKLYVANRFVRVPRAIFGLYTTAWVTYGVTRWLQEWLGVTDGEGLSGFWTLLFFTVGFALADDFAKYIDHVMEHYIPVLWPIHRVHHSAEVLTPFTQYRKHPLSGFASWPISVTITGVFQGCVFYFFMGQVDMITILGVNVVQSLFFLVGSNLRHSHIWFSFGPVLSHIFISPAQHQIHHSMAPQHWNKNFGVSFAIWDWMFGTLYIPNEREDLVFGLPAQESRMHTTLINTYTEPLVSSAQVVRTHFA